MSARPQQPPATIGVVGAAGVVGVSWVAMFRHHGFDVVAQDPAPNLAGRIESFVARAEAALRELVPSTRTPGRVRCVGTLSELGAVDYVQENAPEREELKRQVLAELDALLPPDVVIGSSTSALLRSSLVRDCRVAPSRVIVAHPFNPPHLLPLVELVGAAPEDPAVAWATAFFRGLGKTPIVLRREVVGHIANRLNSSIYREAVSLVEQGVASVEEVDAAMTAGPGPRWAVFGPHLLYHLGGGPGGLRHYLEHLGPSQVRRWADLRTPELTPELCAELIAGVDAAAAGRSVEDLENERDAALLALLRARTGSGATAEG
ncbi:MAG: 3-hydroxyacyl-CoA dehydrogenase [Verrucomicrobia bacterium]|nr:3-hydroxyacyl-CoA dehydrogenase [Verrucomicrobiota bacterium]